MKSRDLLLLAKYGRTVKRAYVEEIRRLAPHPSPLAGSESPLSDSTTSWFPPEALRYGEGRLSKTLHTFYSMGQELSALWESRAATRDQLLRQLQDWCRRAEASEILPLQRFSLELRQYG